jgi:hypothetical protein
MDDAHGDAADRRPRSILKDPVFAILPEANPNEPATDKEKREEKKVSHSDCPFCRP